ncbi:MAG: hypothetical protein NZ521_00175 [Flammeovirgaceae bacterium]|nr:hypothetical protein [Flammeovirgaceae bacterium]MDW8286469.1 hypothetical protein [Flammeovirgaceae bacterium]
MEKQDEAKKKEEMKQDNEENQEENTEENDFPLKDFRKLLGCG